MRTILLSAWLLIPIAGWAYHEGPGQEAMRRDRADRLLAEAHELAVAGQHASAITRYEEALKEVPPEDVAVMRRARVELNKMRMLHRQLPVAHSDLQGLVTELADDPQAEPQTLADARQALANSQYYLTWLMRLEGLPRERWEPEIEAARQNWRLLAEQAEARGADATTYREDIESAVRLARLEIKDLQGLPLPSQ